jgi:hypothetical protein
MFGKCPNYSLDVKQTYRQSIVFVVKEDETANAEHEQDRVTA